jgi:hypothetical protein
LKDIPTISKKIDVEKLYLYPLSDLHFGERAFDKKKFEGYLQIIRDTPNAYCIFNGDLINSGMPGGVGGEDFWEQEPLTSQDQMDSLTLMIEKYEIADKILAIVGGSNHHARAKKAIGHDYDKQFAKDLGLSHLLLDPLGMLFLGVGHYNERGRHKHSPIWYSVLMTHGWAGGRLAGGCVNATRELGAIYGADVIITSHRHLDAGTKDEFYFPDYHNLSVTKIKRMYVSAGTFLGYAAYAQKKGMRPNGTGTPRIRLSGVRKDIHVSI